MVVITFWVMFLCFCGQCEDERQAQLRERARRLLAEARRGSGPTTEVIRVGLDPFIPCEETILLKSDDGRGDLERQNSSGK